MLKKRPKFMGAEPPLEFHATSEIERMVHDGQRLLIYMARDGNADLDPEVTSRILDARYKLEQNTWSLQAENDFLLHYDKLAKMVYPVNVDSINAVVPERVGNVKNKTNAEKAVIRYRRYTMVALLILVVMQAYWLFGNELRNNLQKIFKEREQTGAALLQSRPGDFDWEELNNQLKVDNQRLDANYALLLTWNQIWSFGNRFDFELPPYAQTKYNLTKQRLEEQGLENREAIEKLELDKSEHQVRIVFFENILSASFILAAFQTYILPLLYGLLGSLIYVLRELLKEVKTLTFNFDSDIRYRLRLTLGSLGGMMIGFFLKSDDVAALASLSPMAVAFLMGYNIELLFVFMDNLIEKVKVSMAKNSKDSSTNKFQSVPAASNAASANNQVVSDTRDKGTSGN